MKNGNNIFVIRKILTTFGFSDKLKCNIITDMLNWKHERFVMHRYDCPCGLSANFPAVEFGRLDFALSR